MTLSINEAFRLAADDWRMGAHDRVVAACRAIVGAAPQHVDALNLLGLSLFATGANVEALANFRQALGVVERPDVLNHMGLVLKALNRGDQAITTFLRAIALKPDFAEAHANLGRTLRQAGNAGGALKHLLCAVELDSRLPRPHADLASIYLQRDNLDLATRHFEEHFAIALPGVRLSGAAPRPEPDDDDGKSARIAKMKPALFRAALAAMKDLLDRVGVEFFLGDGTALGCIRGGAFISFDKDIDIGMWDSVPRNRMMTLLDESSEFWVDPKRDPRLSDVLICGRYRDVVPIDIFFYKREADYVWHGLRHGDHDVRWRQTPFDLVMIDFQGGRYRIPSPIDRYLTELYDDWRTPDPDYCAYLSGDIVGGLPLMAKCYALKELQKALGSAQRSKAVAIANELRERLRLYDPSPRLESALEAFVVNHR